jgi:hypothetical protein
MEFITQSQAKAEVRMDRADARMDRLEKQVKATAELVREGMKLVRGLVEDRREDPAGVTRSREGTGRTRESAGPDGGNSESLSTIPVERSQPPVSERLVVTPIAKKVTWGLTRGGGIYLPCTGAENGNFGPHLTGLELLQFPWTSVHCHCRNVTIFGPKSGLSLRARGPGSEARAVSAWSPSPPSGRRRTSDV